MVEQSPDKSMQNAFLASLKASTVDTLLRHVMLMSKLPLLLA